MLQRLDPFFATTERIVKNKRKQEKGPTENTRDPRHVSYNTYKIFIESPFSPRGQRKKKRGIARDETNPGPRDPRFWDKFKPIFYPRCFFFFSPQSLEFPLRGSICGDAKPDNQPSCMTSVPACLWDHISVPLPYPYITMGSQYYPGPACAVWSRSAGCPGKCEGQGGCNGSWSVSVSFIVLRFNGERTELTQK